jgi:NAD(P)H-dependent flavin oxidoreductase YrpB (nitropropane dioxygenase family)
VTSGVWVHQCGSVHEAAAAVGAGADGVVVQGVEAGGHVRGSSPALELLERARAALPAGYPVWLAGGVAERGDVEAALAAGADAVVVGTRLLLSAESDAHPDYKQRLLRCARHRSHGAIRGWLAGAASSRPQRGHRPLASGTCVPRPNSCAIWQARADA